MGTIHSHRSDGYGLPNVSAVLCIIAFTLSTADPKMASVMQRLQWKLRVSPGPREATERYVVTVRSEAWREGTEEDFDGMDPPEPELRQQQELEWQPHAGHFRLRENDTSILHAGTGTRFQDFVPGFYADLPTLPACGCR